MEPAPCSPYQTTLAHALWAGKDPIALREITVQIILAAQTVVAFPPSTVTDVIATKASMDLIAESTSMSAITILAGMGNV